MARRGTIIAAVLIVTALAGMVAAGLVFRVTASMASATAIDDGEKARQAAMSGITRACTILSLGLEDMTLWYDDPDMFSSQKVADDGGTVWYFSLCAPDAADRTKARFGLEDEASRLNINTADRDQLRSIPALTDQLVDPLLDYRDDDDTPEMFGAEQEYYDQLPFPYTARNAPFLTVEELLMVKGFDASVLYGEDMNLNGMLDANENDGDKTLPMDNNDGKLDMGLYGLATTFTYEPATTLAGDRQISINSGNFQAFLDAGIPQQTAEFITVCRRDGVRIGSPLDLLGMEHQVRRDQTLPNGSSYQTGTTISSGVSDEDSLAAVLDKMCADPSGRQGLINVNTAPAEVLATVPGIAQATAQDIVMAREGLDPVTESSIAWLYSHGILDEEKFKSAAGYLTAKSYQYRIHSVGFGVPKDGRSQPRSGRVCVLEALVDISRGNARTVYLRDVTKLGLVYPIDLTKLEEDGS
jgi:type II secretory pathway component PulK